MTASRFLALFLLLFPCPCVPSPVVGASRSQRPEFFGVGVSCGGVQGRVAQDAALRARDDQG